MWHQGIIKNIIQETPTVKRFFLAVEGTDLFTFKAGQFVTFDLPTGVKRNQRWRSYSIASAPSQDNIIELCIVKVEGGLGSTYFFEQVTIGTELKFKGADGTFCLSETLPEEVILICTGTGIAPFRSMILDLQNKQLLHSKIHLIFGCRHSEDVLYRNELETIASQYSDFQYDIVLSRESSANTTHGYVHQIYEKTYANISKNRRFYICGWSKMVDEAYAKITNDLGYEKSQVICELYG
jgi:ferredoxin-NADP reductase